MFKTTQMGQKYLKQFSVWHKLAMQPTSKHL